MQNDIETKINELDSTENSVKDEAEQLYNFIKSHTPWRRIEKKVGRNDICPYCNSGLKFKNCECFNKKMFEPKYTINNGKIPTN